MVYDDMPAPEGPSTEDLAAIEQEWPLIEAEMDLVLAEIYNMLTDRPSDLDWRRLRRAEARVMRELRVLVEQTGEQDAGQAA